MAQDATVCLADDGSRIVGSKQPVTFRDIAAGSGQRDDDQRFQEKIKNFRQFHRLSDVCLPGVQARQEVFVDIRRPRIQKAINQGIPFCGTRQKSQKRQSAVQNLQKRQTPPAQTVRRGSPDPAVGGTAGLPTEPVLETFGRPSSKVRRPCHNPSVRAGLLTPPSAGPQVSQSSRCWRPSVVQVARSGDLATIRPV